MSCNSEINLEDEKKKILKKDKQFSKVASIKGILGAFNQYLDEKGIIIPEKGHLIVGKNNLNQFILSCDKQSDVEFFEWTPLHVSVSKKADLAYTYGKYKIKHADSVKNKKNEYNYYSTVWKKQKNGKWKIISNLGLLKMRNKKYFGKIKNVYRKRDLIIARTDIEFSKNSKNWNFYRAFYNFIDDSGVTISNGGKELYNKKKYKELYEWYEKQYKVNTKMSWAPIYSNLSRSKDLGFTHGYFMLVNYEGSKRIKQYGYYLSIWKSQKNGGYKFVLDGGNTSVAPPF